MFSAPSDSASLSLSAQATITKHLPTFLSPILNGHLRYTNGRTANLGCLTDPSNSEHMSEIEVFSLLEEKVPKYKTRFHLLTDCAEYLSRGWYIPTPALTIPLEGLGLSSDQTRETLNYFLLCGNRVSQMTRAYDDIEAVTRLLEEKEKDLELTVQIGKELLAQNNGLEIKINNLETDLKECNDERSQILYELNKKNELIQILTSDISQGYENENHMQSTTDTLDLLQNKISVLQNENKSLKVEASQLVCKTDEFEEHERKLIADITTQLNESNVEHESLRLELEQQCEENRLQNETIIRLTARVADTEMQLHQITKENYEHMTFLDLSKDTQNCLALELLELKERYQEVISILEEAQEQLRKQQKIKIPYTTSSFILSNFFPNSESLHSEFMDLSLLSENSLDSGFASDYLCVNNSISGSVSFSKSSIIQNRNEEVPSSSSRKKFQTAQCLKKNNNKIAHKLYKGFGNEAFNALSGPIMSTMPYVSNLMSETRAEKNAHCNDCESSQSVSLESLLDGYPSQISGVPGAPGAKDLEAAIRRLTFHKMEPSYGITPDSAASTELSGMISNTNISLLTKQWRIPDKLQIIKPIEGSQTLNHWSKLATPNLSGLLEERPGVTIRGGRSLDQLGVRIYNLSDVEEDITEELPGKQCGSLGGIYTYTTSIVMHPNESLLSDSSFMFGSRISSRMSSASTSRYASCPTTPKEVSRKNSCTTVSLNLGLAKLLNESGIRAITLNTSNTPIGQTFSPTTTSNTQET